MQFFKKMSDAPSVTVISCTPAGWLESSHKMGEDMAAAVGDGSGYTVATPTDAAAFAEVWRRAHGTVIVHTHGSPTCLCNAESADGKPGTPTIISAERIRLLRPNRAIHLVMITACQTAGGDAPDRCTAACLSRKIAPDGIVIANKYTVWGGSAEFGSKQPDGWVIFRAGEALPLPRVLTMADALSLRRMYDRGNK